jgi:hypothetical protein
MLRAAEVKLVCYLEAYATRKVLLVKGVMQQLVLW